MKDRYLGKTGEDNAIVEYNFAEFGKAGNEYFEDIGLIMTNGTITVSVPFQVGKIHKVRLKQETIVGVYEYSVRVWFFNKPITTQVRKEMQDLSTTDMDGLIGFTEFRTANYPSGPEQNWIKSQEGVSFSSYIENIVNMPYVLDENQKIYVIGENIGDPRTYSDTTTIGYLHLKRD